jgi:hypothetical protein
MRRWEERGRRKRRRRGKAEGRQINKKERKAPQKESCVTPGGRVVLGRETTGKTWIIRHILDLRLLLPTNIHKERALQEVQSIYTRT